MKYFILALLWALSILAAMTYEKVDMQEKCLANPEFNLQGDLTDNGGLHVRIVTPSPGE